MNKIMSREAGSASGGKTAVINVKTDPKTKQLAQKAAGNLGVSLSIVINGLLKEFIHTETVVLTSNPRKEEPSEWLINELRQAEEDEKAGYVSPTFDNVKDSIAWLRDPKAKFINGKCK